MAPTRKLAELFYELRARTEGIEKDLNTAERHLGRFTTFVLNNPITAVTALGTAVLAAAAKAAQMAAQIEGAMRKVAAAVPTGQEGIDRLRKTISDLSKETGRSQDEIAQIAVATARIGAESADAVARRTKAAVTLATATGADIQGTVEGLDQVLDLFGHSSEQAAEDVAQLFAAAQGRSSVEDLFGQLQAAAPAINKLGLDISTASRALAALGDTGLSAKQTASALNDLAKGGAAGRAEIQRLASTIPVAGNAMAQLASAADQVNNSAEASAARIRQEFNAVLIELGTKILPTVTGALQDLLSLLDGGTKAAKAAANNFSTILAFGRDIAAARSKNDATAVSFKEMGRAIEEFTRSVAEGQTQLESFDPRHLGELTGALLALKGQKLLSSEQLSDLDLLLKKIEQIRLKTVGAIGVTPTSGERRGVRDVPSTQETQAAASAREDARRAAKDLADGFKDLIEKAEAGKLGVAEFTRSLRDLQDRAEQLKQPALKETAGLFQALGAQADEAGARLRALEIEKLAREFDTLRASLTGNVLDDFATALRDFEAELRNRPPGTSFTEQQIKDLVALKKAALDAQRDLQQAQRDASTVLDSNLPALQKAIELGKQRVALEQELEALTASGQLTDEKRLSIAARLTVIDQALAQVTEENAKHLADAATSGAQFSDALEAALGVALGLATATLGTSHNITRMISAVQQVASGFAKIASLAKEAGSFAKALSTGAGLAGVAGGVGTIIGGIGAIAGLFRSGPDPEQEAQRQLQERNLKVLEDIRAGITDLAQIQTSGGAIARVLQGLDTLVADPLRFAKARGGFGDPTLVLDEGALDAFLKSIGSSFAELQQVAKEFGVELDAEGEGFETLRDVLKQIDLEKFTASLEGTLGLIDARRRAGSLSDQDALVATIQALIDRVPALKDALGGLLEGITSGDPAAREAAIAALQGLLENFGDLPIGALGELNPQDFINTILKLIDGLNAGIPKVKTAAEAFADALELLGIQVELGGLSAAEKIEKMKEAFRAAFGDEFADALDFESVDSLKASIAALIDMFSADGELSEAEKAIVAALRQLLGAVTSAADDEAAKAAAAAAKARQDILDAAERRIRFEDITDPVEQLRIRLDALKEAIPGLNTLLGDFDVSTQEGRDALSQFLAELAEDPKRLAEVAALLGIPVDELLEALSNLEEGADAAGQDIQTLAEKLAGAFSDIDLDARIFGSTLVDSLKKKLAELGITGLDLSTDEGRAKAIAALRALASANPDDDDLRRLIADLIESLQGLNETVGDASGASDGAGGGVTSAAVNGAASITERQANILADLARTQLAVLREIAANTSPDQHAVAAALAQLSGTSLPRLQPPAFLPGGAAGALAGTTRGGDTITLSISNLSLELPKNFSGGPVEAGILQSRAFMRQLAKEISRLQSEELGLARRLQGRQLA